MLSVLVAFTHDQGGPHEVTRLVRGVLTGLPSLIVFCACTSVLLTLLPMISAFVIAGLLGLIAQGVTVTVSSDARRMRTAAA